MEGLKAHPRRQSLLLCLFTFLTGVALISVHLHWDITAEIAKKRTRPKVAVSVATPATPVTALPDPPFDESREMVSLLNQMEGAYKSLEKLEADVLTAEGTSKPEKAGHFYFSKPGGQDISELRRSNLRVRYTAVPMTEVLLEGGGVRAYQPGRKFAVMKNVEDATRDWLGAYMELTGNINLRLVDAGSASTRRPAKLAVEARQPKNVKKATIFVDLQTHLPVRFEVEFPTKNQIIDFDKIELGQPIDLKIFNLSLPAGLDWKSQ
jgi:hypothetical protein